MSQVQDHRSATGDMALVSQNVAAKVVAMALAAEVVQVAGLRLRPASDEQMAANVLVALADAGFDVVYRPPAVDVAGAYCA